MVKLVAAFGLTLLVLGLLWPLGRYARRQAESPSTWISIIVLGWGFLWVGSKYLFTWLLMAGYEGPFLRVLIFRWGFFLIGSLLIYAIIWRRLLRKGKKNMAAKIEEIGK